MQYAFSRIRLRSFFGWMIIGMFLTMIPLSLSGASDNTIEFLSQISIFLADLPLLWLYLKTSKNNVVLKVFLINPDVYIGG